MQRKGEGESEEAGGNEIKRLQRYLQREKERGNIDGRCVRGGEIPICGLWVKAGLQVCGALISLQVCICVCVYSVILISRQLYA